jgi:hypothetical protein
LTQRVWSIQPEPEVKDSAPISAVTALARRAGVLLPIILLTCQMLFAYLRSIPPAAAVGPHGELVPNFYPLMYHRFVYSDLLTLYRMHHLFTHPVPYWDVRIEYPVVTAAFVCLAAVFHGVHAYLLASAVGLWACGVGCVLVAWSMSHRAAWWFAATPLLLVFSLLNWDLLGILLMFLGWRAYVRGRFHQAALWLTLGVFAKLFPLALLAFCVVDLVRRKRAGEVAGSTVRSVLALIVGIAIAINGPFAIGNFANWKTFYSFNAERHEYDGLLFHFTPLSHAPWPVVGAVLVALVLGLAAIGTRSILRGTSPVVAAALLFGGFLILTKVYDPQYALWLFGFAVLAEWPAWALALLSLVGVVDFGNAVVSLYLGATRATQASWYFHHASRLDTDLRLAVLLACTLGVLWGTLRAPRPVRA